MVPPRPTEEEIMTDRGSCVKKERAWTLWSVWSRDIHDKLEVHFKYNHRMYSNLFIATMFRDKISMTPIPDRLTNTEDANGVPPFVLLKVKAVGEFDLQKLRIQADEMKYAENANVIQSAGWELEVHKQLGTVLLDILKVDDYFILWGGSIDPSVRSVELNSANSPPCYIIVYRHDGIYCPKMTRRGEYNNPCSKEAIDNLFFKGTAGEDVTVVQRIEPKSTMSTIWETVEFPGETENGDGERANVAGPSRHTASRIKKEPKQRTQKRSPRSWRSGRRAAAEEEADDEIDLVDLSADEDEKIPDAIPPPIPIEAENENVVDEPDVVAHDVYPVDLEQGQHVEENQDIQSPERPVSQSSEEDFPFPELVQPVSKISTFSAPFDSEVSEVVIYDDSDHEDEVQHLPIDHGHGQDRISPDLFARADEDLVLPTFDTADVEMDTDVEPVTDNAAMKTSETVMERHRNASDSGSSVKSESYRLIEQELANLCRSSEEDMEVDDELRVDDTTNSRSTNTNAKLLKELVKSQATTVPSVHNSQFEPLSQDVMVDPESQLFNDIEDLVSQEMELQADVQEVLVPADAPQSEEQEAMHTLSNENVIDKNEQDTRSADTDSSLSSDDSVATTVVQAKVTVLKQLYELSGVGKFHLHGKVHAFHEIPEKEQIILRVSDGTLIPFVTRKGFPMPSSGDVSLTLQVDILAQHCTDNFIRKVKAANERSTEMVVLSYVKLEKVKRKLFALSMDVAESSDITFGQNVQTEKESSVIANHPAGKEKESTAKPVDRTGDSAQQPGLSSSKPELEPSSARSLPTVTDPISETPQVDPNAAIGAKRRLTFAEAPAPSKPRSNADNSSHQFKKYKLRPLNIKLLALKGVNAGSSVLLTAKFFEDNPQARAPDDAAFGQDADSGPSTSKSKSRTLSKRNKNKKTTIKIVPPTPEKAPDRSDESDENLPNEKEVEEKKEMMLALSARMGIPFVEERSFPSPSPGSKSNKSTPTARNTKGKKVTEEDSKHREGDAEDDVTIQKSKSKQDRSPKPKNKDQGRPSSSRKVRRSKFEINSDISSGSDKSDDSEDEIIPILKTKSATEDNIPAYSLLSDSEEEAKSAPKENSTLKSSPAKKTAKPPVVDLESEPEEQDIDVVEEPESPPPPLFKAAAAKKKYTSFGSDSDESEKDVEEPNKDSRSTAAPGSTKAKKIGITLSDSDSESEKRGAAANPKRKKSVSPAKKVSKLKSDRASSDSDAALESEMSNTPVRRTRNKPAAPAGKIKPKSKPDRVLSDDDSESENEATKSTPGARNKSASASAAKKTKPKSVGVFSDSDASLESEKNETATPARKTTKKAASPAKKTAAKPKSKSGGGFLENDSESEKSDTFIRKTTKKAASPAKNTKPKSKYGGPLTDTDSESEQDDTSARKKRKKSVTPAKKSKAKSNAVYDSDASSASDTSTVRRNLRKRPATVPVRKPTRGQAKKNGNGNGQSIVVELSSDSEKSPTPSPVKQPLKKRARAFINRSPVTTKKAAPKKKRSRK